MLDENLSAPETLEHAQCKYCDSPIPVSQTYCQQCGYPQNGTDAEKDDFNIKVAGKKRLLRKAEDQVGKGKSTLIVLGVLNILVGAYYAFITEDISIAVIQGILAIVYLGLSIWVDKKPFGALLSALILYLTIILISAVIEPTTLFSGIIIKIIIIGFLVRGVRSGYQAKNIYDELDEMGLKYTKVLD